MLTLYYDGYLYGNASLWAAAGGDETFPEADQARCDREVLRNQLRAGKYDFGGGRRIQSRADAAETGRSVRQGGRRKRVAPVKIPAAAP